MTKPKVQVKGRKMLNSSKVLFFLTLLFLLSSCRHLSSILESSHPENTKASLATTQQKQWKPQNFVSHSDWLGMNLDPQPVEQLRQQLESIGQNTLKSRGESHITIITPPEFSQLKAKISRQDLDLHAQKMDLQKIQWKPLCVAQAVNPLNSKMITYYIVVEAPGLLELRKELHLQFVKNGGNPKAFNFNNFHPHITIGFTERDLFESDGIIKDTRHCRFDLTAINPQGESEKITSWNH